MVRVLTGILVQCDAPTMQVIEQLNATRQFILLRLSETDILVKETVLGWLEETVVARLESAEHICSEDAAQWKDKD